VCDFVHCTSEQYVSAVGACAETVVWQFAYDDSIRNGNAHRDIDVLFNSRTSATGYSNHELFASTLLPMGLRVAMTDPTRYYTRSHLGWLHGPYSPAEYGGILQRSRVVVGLVGNGYGGHAFREAIAAGACPVALRTPAYEALLTDAWPYFCNATELSLRTAVLSALEHGWSNVPKGALDAVQANIAKCSYSAAWAQAKADIEGAYNARCH
jgi:hypothetical protein